MSLVKGDRVRWKTKGAGKTTERQGEIVLVLAAGKRPPARFLKKLRDPGGPRDHESYIVRADDQLFWPVVNHLTKETVKQASEVTFDMLSLVSAELPHGMPTIEQIERWSQRDRDLVDVWALAVHLRASDNPVRVPQRPSILDAPYDAR